MIYGLFISVLSDGPSGSLTGTLGRQKRVLVYFRGSWERILVSQLLAVPLMKRGTLRR